jgi:non-ribosomal peptide synthetase component F
MSYSSYSSHLSYQELNEKSNRWAGLLIGKGIRSDTIVALLLDRTIELIIAILGILKAGGAYLPIDPDYPPERIDYMLKDSGARILLKKSEIRNPKFETNPNAPISNDQNKKAVVTILDFEHLNFEFLIGRPRRGLSNLEFRASDLNPLSLAYILYTSGSTGKPKGVLIQHRNVIRLVMNSNFIDFTPTDRLLLIRYHHL